MTVRIAMWSGPRNISTAMMRAWENRSDTVVVDEPFYACYLSATGVDHPMRDEVIASQSANWSEVAKTLSEEDPGAPLFYQKQMTHHLLPGVDLSWTRELLHCFLVRDPYEVVASYRQKREIVSTDDIGIVRQLALYEEISELTGRSLPVIDARTVLLDPRATLSRLCHFLGLSFSDEMLAWPAGRRPSDGVWAPHWYQAVEKSTGFQPYGERAFLLSKDERNVAEESMDAYRTLLARGAWS